jgi:hypothetical protein
MPLGALTDSDIHPDDDSVRAILGRTHGHWRQLLSAIHEQHDPLAEEWHFAGVSFGWSMRVKSGKRTLLYLIPCKGHFLAGLVLGAKAVEAARQAGLPARVLRVIEEARVYAEGRGFRVEVRNAEDRDAIRTLVSIKVDH